MLNQRDADVWSWERLITGRCAAGERCATLHLRVNDASHPVTVNGKTFTALVRLDEGENRVVAVCRTEDGREYLSNPLTLSVRLRHRPSAQIALSLTEDGVVADGGSSRPSEAGNVPITEYRWTARTGNPAPFHQQGSDGADLDRAEISTRRVVLTPPVADGEYYLSLRVVDRDGREDTSTAYFVVSDGEPRLVDQSTEHPAWVDRAVVYGIILRNIGPDGFRSVTERLPYLADLGVTALWLSPANATPEGNFGYAVTDYFTLRPDAGTDAEFREMVVQAHEHGIRVLMDFVPNHTSQQHPYHLDAEAHGRVSGYYDYYDRDESGQTTHYFHWTYLPNLNYDNPEVERWMLKAFSYWVRELDVDGLRVDAAWGVRQRKPDFWPRWRRELKRIKPDLLLLTEASARDPYYFTEGFDAAYDWTDELGHAAWESVFTEPDLITRRLHDALLNGDTGYHPDALLFRFLNNNDTAERFITRYGEGLTRVATALLLTLPGIPCVYLGDEVGAQFSPYVDAGPITRDHDYDLLGYHKKLIALRKDLSSLHSREWEPIQVEPAESVYGYLRFTHESAEPVLVLLNWRDETVDAEVQLPGRFGGLGHAGRLLDALSGEQVVLEGGQPLRVPMAAYSARILTIEV